REPYSRFLTDLERREPQIDIQREPLGVSLIEDRLAPMTVGKLTKAPDQLFRPGARADRIAERDPTAAGDLIHEERIRGVVEEKPLIARQGRIREAVVGAVDDGARAHEIICARNRRLRPRRA